MGKDYSRFWTAEELRADGWIQEEEALKLLGLTKGKDFDWFDYDYIDAQQCGADGEQWVKLLPELAERLGVGRRALGVGKTENGMRNADSDSNAKCKVGEKGPRKRDWREEEGNRPRYSFSVLTVKEAAAELGLTAPYVRRMCHMQLNAYRENGRVWIPVDEVERYRRKQRVWAEKGGLWTPYGRREKIQDFGNHRHLRIEEAGPGQDKKYAGGIRGW